MEIILTIIFFMVAYLLVSTFIDKVYEDVVGKEEDEDEDK